MFRKQGFYFKNRKIIRGPQMPLRGNPGKLVRKRELSPRFTRSFKDWGHVFRSRREARLTFTWPSSYGCPIETLLELADNLQEFLRIPAQCRRTFRSASPGNFASNLQSGLSAELDPLLCPCGAEMNAISWFVDHYPKIMTGTIIAHLVRLSTNARTRLH